MSEPLVCAVMLTKDRPEMAARAVRSFRAQTYGRASIIALDTGAGDNLDIQVSHMPKWAGRTIGALRNELNSLCSGDIICHFDSDDISHPRRIEEQVALLQASGKECVGYHDMLFWRDGEQGFKPHSTGVPIPDPSRDRPSEAWLYQNRSPRYALGTSLCYWRSAWEKRPFPDKNRGEDHEWVYGVDCMGVSSIPGPLGTEANAALRWASGTPSYPPRMIASIHASNGIRVDEKAAHHWSRAAEWDQYCRERMKL
jgi:glycosyltransferase involved in cell wall biosynthesis